jgi:AcrR family transcriptional regulator
MSTNPHDDPRRRVLDGAARLYREHGLAGLTTEALARALGTSKRTLYAHFPNREAIVEAVLLERLERLAHDLAAVEASPGPFAARLRRHAEVVALVPQDLPPGFWAELHREAPTVAARVRARRDAMSRESLHRLLGEAVAAGAVRADLPVARLAAVAEALGEALLRVEPPPGETRMSLVEAGLAVLFHGILTGRA